MKRSLLDFTGEFWKFFILKNCSFSFDNFNGVGPCLESQVLQSAVKVSRTKEMFRSSTF